MKCEVVAKSYRVEITPEELSLISTYDNELDIKDMLFSKINRYGAYNTDYNGHFGPYIFYSVEVDYDTQAFKADIKGMIKQYIKDARAWEKNHG